MLSKNIFVNRPIMAISLNLILIIIGIVAYNNLTLRHQPNEKKYSMTINTKYIGANSNVIEEKITKPFEESLSGIDGIKSIFSSSSDNNSFIEVKFESNINFDKAYSDVRDKILARSSYLPKEVDKPLIRESKSDPFNVIYLTLTDDTRSLTAISDYFNRNLKERLSMVEGVASINIFNNLEYRVEVSLDEASLFKNNVTVTQVLSSLKDEKIYATAGQLETSVGKKTVVLTAPLGSVEDIGNIPVSFANNQAIRLSDVGTVNVSKYKDIFKMRVDGKESIGMAITAKPQSNPIEVSDKVKIFVEKESLKLPSTMNLEILYDATGIFRSSISEVIKSLWEAIFLVGVVVTFSLASFRAAIMPIITVPLCLIGTFIFIWGFGFSINPITLLAMVLAVGLVVDDAIVVVENIYKHMSKGLNVKEAASKSMKEITFAVIVMTITLAAVYLPLALQKDSSAVLLKEFSWTLSSSVLISGFVALTLIPALCGAFLKPHKDNFIEKIWKYIEKKYTKLLHKTIRNPLLVCMIAFFSAIIGFGVFLKLPSELKPKEDDSFVTGYISYTNQVNAETKKKWQSQLEAIFEEDIQEKDKVLMFNTDSNIWWNVILKPRKDRNVSKDEIINRIKDKVQSLPGPIFAINNESSGGLEDETIRLVISTQSTQEHLLSILDNLKNQLEQNSLFSNVQVKNDSKVSRINFVIDRKIAENLGVNIQDVENTLTAFLSGKKVSNYNFDGYDYDIVVRGNKDFRTNLSKINALFLTTKKGTKVPLGSLVTIKEELYPSKLNRYDKVRGGAIRLTLAKDVSFPDALNSINEIMNKVLTDSDKFYLKGSAEKYKESKKAILATFLLAIIFIYLMLAALFESFVDPFVVMLTVPLSITGAIIAVYFIDGTNNIFMQIGIITLIGLITKHGILIVDFSKKLIAKGDNVETAVLNAASLRLRPILMTTIAIIFGAISLIFSVGMGAVARKHIGWVIIGGMTSGTILSLFFIPLVCIFSMNYTKRIFG